MMQWLEKITRPLRHPILHYSVRSILDAVKQDWERETLAEYHEELGDRRQWWSGGTWLHPGDEVCLITRRIKKRGVTQPSTAPVH